VLRTIRAVLKDKGQTVDPAANVRQALEWYPPLPGARRAGHELPPLTGDGVIAVYPTGSHGSQRHRRGLGVTCACSRNNGGSAASQSRRMGQTTWQLCRVTVRCAVRVVQQKALPGQPRQG